MATTYGAEVIGNTIPLASLDEFQLFGQLQCAAESLSTICVAQHKATAQFAVIKTNHGYPDAIAFEANLLSQLNNQHVIRPSFRSFPHAAVEPFLALPLLEPVEPGQQGLIEQLNGVAEGLDYVHDCGFLHNDVKPTNLLRVPREDIGVLNDFSHACSIDNPSARPGTDEYGAPEAQYHVPLSRHSDYYSLALTAYVLLFGHRPASLAQVPAAFQRALSLNPYERPDSAAEFMYTLANDPDPELQRILTADRPTIECPVAVK